jgi:hypothetical protein
VGNLTRELSDDNIRNEVAFVQLEAPGEKHDCVW